MLSFLLLPSFVLNHLQFDLSVTVGFLEVEGQQQLAGLVRLEHNNSLQRTQMGLEQLLLNFLFLLSVVLFSVTRPNLEFIIEKFNFDLFV